MSQWATSELTTRETVFVIVTGTSISAGRFVNITFPAGFDSTKLNSLNGILNNEHGTSTKITSAHAQTFTLGTIPIHNDE